MLRRTILRDVDRHGLGVLGLSVMAGSEVGGRDSLGRAGTRWACRMPRGLLAQYGDCGERQGTSERY